MKHLKKFNESVNARKMSDYTIFKIRYYADGVDIAKGVFDDDKNQGWERAKLLNSLFSDFVEFITKKPMSYWMGKYGFGYTDCMKEELHESYGIIIPNSEEYDYWFIPNEMKDVIEWVKSNCKLPYSIVKRYSNDEWLSRKTPMNIHRKMARPIGGSGLNEAKSKDILPSEKWKHDMKKVLDDKKSFSTKRERDQYQKVYDKMLKDSEKNKKKGVVTLGTLYDKIEEIKKAKFYFDDSGNKKPLTDKIRKERINEIEDIIENQIRKDYKGMSIDFKRTYPKKKK